MLTTIITDIYSGGSRILQRRVSNPSAMGTGGRALKATTNEWGGVCAPSTETFCISYIKMVFLCIRGDIYWHCSFQKGHPNQKGGCPVTLDTPGFAPDLTYFCFLLFLEKATMLYYNYTQMWTSARPATEDVTQGPPVLTTWVVLSAPVQPVIKETDFLVQVVTFSIIGFVNGVHCRY